VMSTGLRDGGQREKNTHDKGFGRAVHAATGGMASDILDTAHSSIYSFLNRARVVEESAFKGSSSPQHLTVKANGRELVWGEESREGRVNPNRLQISIRWAKFRHRNVSKLVVQLMNFDDDHVLCSSSLVNGAPQLLNQSDEVERLEDGLALACHALQENAKFRVNVQVQPTSTDGELSKAWTIETADLSSGDAQGRIMFLPADYNVTELQQQYGDDVGKIMARQRYQHLIAKEVTIFDVDDRDSGEPQMDIHKNGFEFDTSGDLRGALEDFRQLLDKEAKVYRVQTERRRIGYCFFNHSDHLDDLDKWVQAAKDLSAGKLSPTTLPCRRHRTTPEKVLTRKDLNQNYTIRSFWKKCRRRNKHRLDCSETVTLEQIANHEFELPVQIELLHPPYEVEKALWTANLAATGTGICSVNPEMRKQTIKKLVDSYSVVNEEVVKVLNPDVAEAALAVIEASAEATQTLLEAMEQHASQWWKDKTGTDTKSFCFSAVYRHTRAGVSALPVAHVDAIHVAEWFRPGGLKPVEQLYRLKDVLGMDLREALKHVVVTFNEWVNAGRDDIVELPLTMLDTATVEKKDTELAWLLGNLDSKMVRWSEAHKWYYRSLKLGQGYMFMTSEHQGPEHNNSGTPHSAFQFIHKEGAGAERARESFEFRCLVINPDWTSPSKLFENVVPEAPTQQQIVQSMAASVMGMFTNPETFLKEFEDNDDLVNVTDS